MTRDSWIVGYCDRDSIHGSYLNFSVLDCPPDATIMDHGEEADEAGTIKMKGTTPTTTDTTIDTPTALRLGIGC